MATAISLCKCVSAPFSTRLTPSRLFAVFANPKAGSWRPNSAVKLGSLKRTRTAVVLCSRSSSGEAVTAEDAEWLKRLPDKNKPLYSHSLPCIEAWLKQLGFRQSIEDRAVWFIEKPEWHAQVSLDLTDLHIRYLKTGPGDLDKDVDRRFSYALSRDDIENAILGGP